MVVIYEPLCKGFSHEKINSGFIFSFRKAFPNEEIYFYADKTHIKAIKNILLNDGLLIDNLNFLPISIAPKFNSLSFIINFFNLLKLLRFLREKKENRIFLTSFNSIILFIIKTYKIFYEINYYLVLHGSFEEINHGELNVDTNQIIKYSIPSKPFINKIKNINIFNLYSFFTRKKNKFLSNYSLFKVFFQKKLSTKEIIESKSNQNITYIAISKHIIYNAQKILDFNKIKILYHFYPNHFSNFIKISRNKYVKFAIFGYGDPLILYNISKNLEKRNINKEFEIRIIGMDNSISNYFSFIKSPSNGKALTREEMEKMTEDIDIFLILYGNQRYRLSCSATILEAISYNKPIIHFKNDCISQFNTPNARIGFESNSINEFCDHMGNCIINYDKLGTTFNMFYLNLLKLRSQYSIDKNFSNLIEIYK